ARGVGLSGARRRGGGGVPGKTAADADPEDLVAARELLSPRELYGSGDLFTENGGERSVGYATAILPVDRIDRCGVHPDQDLALARLRALNVLELQHVDVARCVDHDGLHRGRLFGSVERSCRIGCVSMKPSWSRKAAVRVVGAPRSQPNCFVRLTARGGGCRNGRSYDWAGSRASAAASCARELIASFR